MRKNLLKSLLLTLMVLVGGSAWGIEVKTTFDFSKGTSGTTPTLSSSVHHKAGNSSNVYLATDDICKNRFCFQAVSTTDHVFEYSNSKIQQTKGDRWFSVVDLKAGDKIAFTFTVANAGSSTDKHFTVEKAGTGTSTNLSLTEGGDAIAANTDMVSETEYYVLADGYIDFKTRKNFYLTKVVITSNVGEETVSKPELTITGANLGARTVSIKSGESSINNTTTTYYTIDGSVPTTASASSTTQYTPVVVGEGATEESTVTIKAITVSSGNVSSEVAELAVPVGTTIQLDAPTIAITGMALNGEVFNPIYTFTGTQSVIGTPTASLSYSIDSGANTEGVSCTMTAPGTITVTVSAEGYASNSKDFVIKNAVYTLSKTIDLSADNYVDVSGFGTGTENAHWANFGAMSATIYTLPETTSLPGITINSVTYSQFSPGLGLGFASGTRTATVNDTKEGEIGEFVLYTGGSLEDAKNVSNFVEYNEGITFTVPATGTAQALKKINVYSPKVEEPAPEIVVVDGSEYIITGENIITNGSFDNGVDGWYSGNWNNASASNYTLQTEGGFDGGAYLQYSAGGAGADSNIRGKWAVENGKTYLFRCYTSGKTPTSNNLQYSKFWASADGSAETTALYQLKWGANPEQVSDTWTLNDYVFTATTDWVVFRSSWTTDTKLDGFMLVEVERYFSPEGYNTALAAAKTALADEEYTIVTGEERTALATTIETYANATADKYQEAIEALDAAKTTFVNAKAAYQALADVKLDIQMVGYDERFPYATAEKKTTAQATLTAEPTKAADATTMTAAIYKAYRQFAESHAMAEGVEGAVNMTDAITNPKAESAIAEPWKVVLGKGSGGSLDVKNSEPWTDGDDNATHNYFDGGNWGANAWDVSLQQNITLPAGKYMMTVKSRASDELTFTLFAGNDSTGMPALGASGNLFDRGWNDASIEFVLNSDSTLAIGVNGVAESVHQWMSFSDFRLVQLEKYETPEPVDPNDYTSYIVNADLTAAEIGWNAEGTKTGDYKEGAGIVKAGNNAQFDFKQTIANLPAGKYKVTAQAAYRYSGSEADEYAAIAAGTPTKFAKLYATVGKNTIDTLVQNRYDGASETNYLGQDDGVATVNEKFVPNSSDAVKAWFAAGQYVNEVVFNIAEEGPVTIGIVKTAQPEAGDYTVIGPWTLTRLGDAEVEPEPQPAEPEFAQGKYILVNAASEMCWGAGNDWGTRASLVKHPEYNTLIPLPDGTYHLESQVSNGGTAYYFNGDYMDNDSPVALTITKVAEPIGYKDEAETIPVYAYTIANGDNYYGWDGTSTVLGKNLAADSENALWMIVSEEDMFATLQDATVDEPVDATFLIADHTFGRNNRNKSAWTNEGNADLTGGNSNKHDAEKFHGVFNVYQKLAKAPVGVYKFTAQGFYRQDGSDDENLPVFYANDVTTKFPLKTGAENSMADACTSFEAGLYSAEPMYVKVTEAGELTIGAKLETNTNLWCIWDNFVLTYYGAEATLDEVMNGAIIAELADLREKAADLVDDVEVEAVKSALNTALTETAEASGTEAINAAIATLKAAIEKANIHINAAVSLAAMENQMNSTNVYTAEAFKTYKGIYDAAKIKYEAGELTNADVIENPEVLMGWHAANQIDDLLLSAWTIGETQCKDYDAGMYINTWSVEGDTDGSNFKVPFFEYWTGDANSLGENVLTATMTNLPEGEYDVTAWVRVRIKNGAEAPAAGITFQANDGEAVNVAAGDQVGTSQMYLKEFTATGTVVEDGVLKIKFNVAAENNISWLSFKNVKFEKKAVEPQDTVLALALNVERYPGMGYGVTEATVDFSEAKEFLGVEAITTDMLSIVNPDNTTISDYAPYDGWFNAEGAAESWVSMNPGAAEEAKAGICVKFFQAIPEGKYEICDMNGADEVGKTYSVKWQLAANGKKVIYTINVTFVEKPVITLTFADLTKKDEQTVALTSTLGSKYEGLTADVDIAAILAKLEVSSLNDVTIYAVQSDGSLDDNYKLGTTDGWRNAAGDWQTWGDDAYFFVKADFTKESAQIYEAGGMENKNTTADWENPASYTATYAFVKTGSTDAVVLKVTLTYTVPTGINAIATDAQKSVIFNMNGQKMNKAQKGLYIINGHKVVIK